MRTTYMRIPGRVGTALTFWAALFAGIATASTGENKPVSWEVTISMFSGRPDPVYALQEGEVARVQAMLSQAKPSAEPKEEATVFTPGRLGFGAYRGVVIRLYGEGRVVQSSIRVHVDDILRQSGSSRAWLNTSDTALEEYLLDLAVQKGKIKATVREGIRVAMEKEKSKNAKLP